MGEIEAKRRRAATLYYAFGIVMAPVFFCALVRDYLTARKRR